MMRVIALVIAALASAVTADKSSPLPLPPTRDFTDGLAFGHIAVDEAHVSDAWLVLQVLDREDGAKVDQLRKIEVTSMNSSLESLGHQIQSLSGRSDWPVMIHYLVEISSPNCSELMLAVKQRRQDRGWMSNDAEQERLIGIALDRYADFGNAYGMQTKSLKDWKARSARSASPGDRAGR